MQSIPGHENGLYHPDMFKSLLTHEVNNSRRYGDSLTLVNLFVETDPAHPEARNDAELLIMNRLRLDLRDSDIACKQDNEFLILLPSTSTPGARTACERLKEKIMAEECAAALTLSLFIGMASMPAHNPITSEQFAENAARALQYARANGLTSVVAFSDVIKD
jgi:predicted signal transduction protein with EAL and GGDEF domain